MDQDIKHVMDFYDDFDEDNRMKENPLEYIRCKDIISRYLSKESMSILDIGGATGVFSFWLSEQGHNVTLIDFVPKHIEIAKKREIDEGIKLAAVSVGDARNLPFESGSFDLVLLMGPLYHLVDKNERLKSLQEAFRVLKPKGRVIGEVISRFASLFDGFLYGLVDDPDFVTIMQRDIKTGFHRDSSECKKYFTDAYFHRSEELSQEMSEVGFYFEELIAVTSFGNAIPDIDNKIKDDRYLNILLDTIKQVEKEPMLYGISSHFVGIGKKA